MTNSPEEQLRLTTPEYQTAVGELFAAASYAMDYHSDFVEKRNDYGRATVTSLRLESDSDKVITLERELSNPLPKDPDWSSALPRIRKLAPHPDGALYQHEYRDVHGLIIDRKSYDAPKNSRWGAINICEDELSFEDVVQLAYDIVTWAPVEQVHTRRSRVAKGLIWVLNKM